MRKHDVTLRWVFDPLAVQRPPRPQFPTSNCFPPARRRAVMLVQFLQASGRGGSGLLEGVEKRLCSFQIDRVEPFGEPVVDRLKERQASADRP